MLLFLGAWQSPTTVNVGGPDDPPLIMWFLRWTPYAITHGEIPFLTDHLNYPAGVNLMWNTAMVLPAILLWPVTAAFGPVAAYNTLITAGVALSGWTAYLAFRYFLSGHTASFIGGLVYAFSPYMMSQAREHSNLTFAAIPPLLLIVLHQILVRQDRSPRLTGVILGLLAAAQLLITEELLASEAFVAAIGIAILLLVTRPAVAGRLRHALAAFAYAACTFVAITAWPLYVQFFGHQRVHGVIQSPNTFVIDLLNFVVPSEVQWLTPAGARSISSYWTGNLYEWNGYLGIPLLVIVAFVTVRRWSNPLVRFSSLLGLAVAVCSLGPSLHVYGRDTGIPLPWRLVDILPVVSNMLPSRLMLYAHLSAALLVAVFVQQFVVSRPWRQAAPAAVALSLVAAALFPSLPFPSSSISVPKFFRSAEMKRIAEGTVVLVAPIQQLLPSAPMLWQAEADMRFRMTHGYFIAPDPAGKPVYGAHYSATSLAMYSIQKGEQVELSGELRREVLRDLAARQVGGVLVGPMRHREAMLDFFTVLFGRDPEHVQGVSMWTDLSGSVKSNSHGNFGTPELADARGP